MPDSRTADRHVVLRSLQLAAALGWLAGVGTAPLAAQTIRSFTTYRQRHDETRLIAQLNFAAGSLHVKPGRPGELYRMELAYDADRFRPLSRFDAAASAVTLGVESTGGAGFRMVSGGRHQQIATVELSPSAELALALALGATEADLELGGLRLSTLRVQSGASRTLVRFSVGNPIPCREAAFETGAAELVVRGLGHSRCAAVRLAGGVGRALIDFAGAGATTQRIEINLPVAALTVQLPRGVPARLARTGFLARFAATGFERRGDDYVTAGFDAGRPHIDIAISAAVAEVRVEWVDR